VNVTQIEFTLIPQGKKTSLKFTSRPTHHGVRGLIKGSRLGPMRGASTTETGEASLKHKKGRKRGRRGVTGWEDMRRIGTESRIEEGRKETLPEKKTAQKLARLAKNSIRGAVNTES